ncbi:hypothetical protein FPOAC2_07472 [Fusarium poae]
MLALSSTADTDRLRGIVEYTAAIVFLGTPHRGSPEFSAIGERARVVLNSLGFQTTAAILDALRLGNNDLQRAHESFTRLWQKYDFRVKTIQEGLGLSGFNFGVLGAKVVPDSSSIIGDPREHAETLQANHFGICRFRSGTDPNYIKVSGEIRDIYSRIETAQTQCHDLVKERGPSQLRINSDRTIYPSNVEPEIGENNPERLTPSMLAAFIESLGFEGMHYRQESISPPSDNTLQWLFENPVYGSWRTSPNPSDRLLFIKGNPGSGKSVLMKEAVRDMQSTSNEKFASASFFVNARGRPLDHSTIGLLRSLLCQLLPYYFRLVVDSSYLITSNCIQGVLKCIRIEPTEWTEQQLEVLVIEVISDLSSYLRCPSVFIFIDALDELDDAAESKQAELWRRLVFSFRFRHLRVCLSCRNFPHVSINGCVQLELPYGQDLHNYIRDRLDARISPGDNDWKQDLKSLMFFLAQDNFLWVVLVVDKVLEQYDKGISLKRVKELIHQTPKELQSLYESKIRSLEKNEVSVATRMFQWAIAAARPLRLDEWHHIMAFITPAPPRSLREWRESNEFIETDEQLERKIRNLSRGLLEVSRKHPEPFNIKASGASSIHAGAGSLDHEQGSARLVQIIHESVRWFLLKNGGFALLETNSSDYIASCHMTIAATCIDYMHIPELDDLATARQKMRMRSSVSSSGRSASVLSERQKLNTPQHNRQPKGILKSLQEMPAPDSLDLVESWILGEFPTSNSFPVVESWSDSPPLDSVGIASQALPDYPALLVYSVNELCYHIMEAMNFNESVFELPERLNDAATWQRLADLGINKDIFTQAIDIKRLQHFFKHSSILLQSRRVRKHRQNTEEPPRQGHGVFYEVLKRVRGLGDLGKHKRNGSEDFQQPRITRRDTSSIQSRRRPRSIASFSSADSHRRAQSV